jgi:16S rRNA (cytosine1402-N4)-methyltransferase
MAEASGRGGPGNGTGAAAYHHAPVLLREVLEWMAPAPGKRIVDGTLGGGGHAEAMLEAGAEVIGIDQDPEALESAGRRLARFGGRFRAVEANFSDVARVLAELGVEGIDGALLDLGVSSRQLDEPARGFSFRAEGPLDMRMSPRTSTTAADLVNLASAGQLARIFRRYGEEPSAMRVARAIERQRQKTEFRTTLDLARLVESVLPRRGKIHPATRVFQALRIAVNREIEALEEGLEAFEKSLRPGGRMAVISFHSLEDRAVKQFFRDRSAEWIDRPEWPEPKPNPALAFRLLTRRAVVATDEEIENNPRSRSAKLRAAEKREVPR